MPVLPINTFRPAAHTLWTYSILRAPKFIRPPANLRGLASALVIRPRRFWDLHVPYETWDYRERVRLTYDMRFERFRSWSWVSISDRNLPEPWSCNWECWRLAYNNPPVEATLPLRYAISNEPLTPVMFATGDRGVDSRDVSIFACPVKKTWYLYRPRDRYYDRADEEMWCFHGFFTSVREFIEKADWNRMEKIEPCNPDDGLTACHSSHWVTTMKKFARHGDGRTAANQPFAKRTLLDMIRPPGTYLHEARDYNDSNRNSKPYGPSLARALREWPRIPDSDLPEPWSCRWEWFEEATDWYYYEGVSTGESEAEMLVEVYGAALNAFIPAMFVTRSLRGPRGDIVLCPPGFAGTYYLWWNEGRTPSDTGDLHRFSGVYASVEHFIRTADWNKLEQVPYLDLRD
ncbi:hypothetical protein C8R47DRAFT_1212192 [Mycena vitilis]|nr:hypothetical protein C8R47DRAFT_1212192 [Mycena vitilis]